MCVCVYVCMYLRFAEEERSRFEVMQIPGIHACLAVWILCTRACGVHACGESQAYDLSACGVLDCGHA